MTSPFLCSVFLDGNFPTLFCTYINEKLSDYEEQILGCNRMRDMFLLENSQKCFGLPIYNDEQVERTEHAGLTLALRDTSSIVEFKPDYKFTAIHIKDNDSKLYWWYVSITAWGDPEPAPTSPYSGCSVNS